MHHFVNVVCKAITIALLGGVSAVAEEPACPHSSPQVKTALDAARKNAEHASDQYVRSELLHEVAKGYARNGDFEVALQVIRVESRLMWPAADELAKNMLRCGQAPQVKAAALTWKEEAGR